jgi:hypothetical protein
MTGRAKLSLRPGDAEAANEPVRVPRGSPLRLRVHGEDVRRGWGSDAFERGWRPPTGTATAEPAHSLRAGSKGVSSGAARASSTSGASSSAVAGASVTPSIPCPVAR